MFGCLSVGVSWNHAHIIIHIDTDKESPAAKRFQLGAYIHQERILYAGSECSATLKRTAYTNIIRALDSLTQVADSYCELDESISSTTRRRPRSGDLAADECVQFRRARW